MDLLDALGVLIGIADLIAFLWIVPFLPPDN